MSASKLPCSSVSVKRVRDACLFVVSGPSGTGKGTLLARLCTAVPSCWLSVSATTREPRPGEVEGIDYYFLSPERFDELVANDGFLEWAEYSGNRYGTPRASVEQHLAAGENVILEIEVQGAFQVRENAPDARLVFIEPPSLAELEARLRKRGTETEEAIARRLETAKLELSRKMDYDKRLVNDDLETAAAELIDYVESQTERHE